MTHDDVLELAPGYVLGILTPEEEALVRDHLATCGESHEAFEELGGVVPYLADLADPVEPPAALKDRILAAAAADLEERRAAPAPAPAVTPFPDATERAERAARRPDRPSPLTWVAALAAVLVIAVLGAWNLTLQRNLDAVRAYERGLSAVLDVAAQPGSQTAVLTGHEGQGPSGIAAVAPDGRVELVMRDLEPTAGSEVYEAWVIGEDGTPRPIGGFTVGDDGTATFTAPDTPAAAGVTLALTREPGPGAQTPTLPIVSAGVATAPSS
jgi:anti-sigma-K factor RskA